MEKLLHAAHTWVTYAMHIIASDMTDKEKELSLMQYWVEMVYMKNVIGDFKSGCSLQGI